MRDVIAPPNQLAFQRRPVPARVSPGRPPGRAVAGVMRATPHLPRLVHLMHPACHVRGVPGVSVVTPGNEGT